MLDAYDLLLTHRVALLTPRQHSYRQLDPQRGNGTFATKAAQKFGAIFGDASQGLGLLGVTINGQVKM